MKIIFKTIAVLGLASVLGGCSLPNYPGVTVSGGSDEANSMHYGPPASESSSMHYGPPPSQPTVTVKNRNASSSMHYGPSSSKSSSMHYGASSTPPVTVVKKNDSDFFSFS